MPQPSVLVYIVPMTGKGKEVANMKTEGRYIFCGSEALPGASEVDSSCSTMV